MVGAPTALKRVGAGVDNRDVGELTVTAIQSVGHASERHFGAKNLAVRANLLMVGRRLLWVRKMLYRSIVTWRRGKYAAQAAANSCDELDLLAMSAMTELANIRQA